ncbi:MAG: lysophospholipid acyltransferase family protein [Halieaceae bacterium]|nr:lysophospholipid acyltransferase family protein [Halieaceae bacterium]
MSPSNPRAAVRATALLAVIAALLPFYLVAFPLGARARRLFSYPFFRSCLVLTGLSLRISGAPAGGKGILYVANHVSYMDIPVLASLIDGCFIAKSEVRGWPLFGLLAILGRTVFVSRQTSNLRRERVEIARRLARGESVFLFPEGSSSNGAGVLPFRSGLFSAVQLKEGADTIVQPLSIVYGPMLGNRPCLGQSERDRYAWYGEGELLPHLWRLFGSKEKIVVLVAFHSPRQSRHFSDRRALSQWAEQSVSQGIHQALSGPNSDRHE